MAQIEHKGFARLLAIVDHIEPGLNLLLDDCTQGGAPCRVDGRRLHGFAANAPGKEGCQRRWARQASRMRRQDAILAALHRRCSCKYVMRRRAPLEHRSRSVATVAVGFPYLKSSSKHRPSHLLVRLAKPIRANGAATLGRVDCERSRSLCRLRCGRAWVGGV